MVTKYAEKVKIYNHYTNYKGRLFVKTLCDLFNDAAEVQTELYKVDVDTLNAQGFTWMLHRLHILLHKMPLKEEIVTIETGLRGSTVCLPCVTTGCSGKTGRNWCGQLPNGCISI